MTPAAHPFIQRMPKVELHIHLEGTLSPEQVLEFAARNRVTLPYANAQEIRAAQDYGEPALANFLRYHETITNVLRTPRDFSELADRFFATCRSENIRHTEFFVDPQPHMDRGISFDALIEVLTDARLRAERDLGVSSLLIICANRDRSAESAMELLEHARKHAGSIAGVGLDSLETGNPPIKFLAFYRRAAAEGYNLTAHCDCNMENSVQHIWQCLEQLKVQRVDHGLHCLDDPRLMSQVRELGIGLTMCPTWRPSDPAPRRVDAVRRMLHEGLLVSLNTDDPEEFASGYLSGMLTAVQNSGEFTDTEMTRFMQNAIASSWMDPLRRAEVAAELERHAGAHI